MTDEQFSVEEISNDFSNNPLCPHGPTLLFSRKYKDWRRKFYACSACRDRKLCRFFVWADEHFSEERKDFWKAECEKFVGCESHNEIYSSVHKLTPFILKKKIAYCHTCCKFMFNSEVSKHGNHDVTSAVSMDSMMHPTELLKPLDCNKREAQYLFSKASTRTIIKIMQDIGVESVICIGVPRIHEYINTSDITMDSILLDFDRRYHMFYKPEEYCWYNSFNNHFFFGDESKNHFVSFLSKNKRKKMLIILDPPFGGRIEPLSRTLQSMQELHKKLHPHEGGDIQVIFINPYFMEQHVIACLPSFRMVDYKVTYDNHSSFSAGPKSKKSGSAVRIFTNISLDKIILPIEEGYKFCKICNRWVCAENEHCRFCEECTSKNGSKYVHCFKCQKCVKSSWRHCNKCDRCCLESHSCSPNIPCVKCHLCDEEGHKQQNCLKFQDNNCEQVLNIANKQKKKMEQ